MHSFNVRNYDFTSVIKSKSPRLDKDLIKIIKTFFNIAKREIAISQETEQFGKLHCLSQYLRKIKETVHFCEITNAFWL